MLVKSELELDAQIKFIDGMSSSDIQDALIKTAVEKNRYWCSKLDFFVAARLFVFDLYHRLENQHGIKGEPYCHLKDYLKYGKRCRKINSKSWWVEFRWI